jgi:pimeloyl-ACP methyl ester carboxylesterase
MSHGTLTPPLPPEFGVEDGYDRETSVAPLLDTNEEFCFHTGTNTGDDDACGLDEDRLVPLLDPRGHGMCPGWWCERCGAFCFFFTVCTASLIASAATMAVCVADTGSMVVVYSFLAPEFQIWKPETSFAYRFNHTLNDLVWSSWVRTFLALASHAASRRENLYTPYLFVSLALSAVCGAHAGLKARYFDYAGDQADLTVAPLMFAITITACLAHVAVAASMRVHARKTLKRQAAMRAGVLGFRFSESGLLRSAENEREMGTENPSAASPRTGNAARGTEGNAHSVFDAEGDVQVDVLCDRDSQFAVIRGVRIHYKDSIGCCAERRGDGGGGGGRVSDDPPRTRAWGEEPEDRPARRGEGKGNREDFGGFFPPDAAVVFVHGFGAGAFSWRKIAPSLATTLGVRTVCLDRPGFGFSARPRRGEFSETESPYDVLEQARIVLDLCAFLGVERVLFVGHADGCLVAMRAAAEAEVMTPLEAEPASVEAGGAPLWRRGDARKRAAGTEFGEPSAGIRRGYGGDGVLPTTSSVDRLGKRNGSRKVRVAGLALLGADARLDAAVPAPVRLLLNTKLGEKMLRPLLRTEIGEVANRRAWFDRSKLTRETLRLYQRPLCVEGWDAALMEAARTRQKMTQRDVSVALQALADTPALMVTGADDVIAPPTRAIAVAAELRRCALKILPRCGHLPHEESPRALLEALRPFVLETLQRGGGRARGEGREGDDDGN